MADLAPRHPNLTPALRVLRDGEAFLGVLGGVGVRLLVLGSALPSLSCEERVLLVHNVNIRLIMRASVCILSFTF